VNLEIPKEFPVSQKFYNNFSGSRKSKRISRILVDEEVEGMII